MSIRVYDNGVLLEEWDDPARTYRRYQAGAVVEQRPYTAGESSDAALRQPPAVPAWTFAGHGIRAGDPARPLNANGYVKIQSSHADPTGMVIWTQKVAGDSADVNVDGSVIVKHGKDYTGTPGYVDTLQVYTLAGSSGTIIGNNDYSGYESELPYAPGSTETGKGYVRFELGPRWPRSEVGRFNNSGDFMAGGFVVHKPGQDGVTPLRTFRQSGSTVTQVDGNDMFAAADVGKFLLWDGAGTDGTCDRIVSLVNSVTVRVESVRIISTARSASVVTPRFTVTKDGRPQWSAQNTQTTVGAAGGASAPPATPKRWLRVLDADGTVLVIPAYLP